MIAYRSASPVVTAPTCMRAIVFCLLLANVFYMAWHHWIRLPEVPVPEASA